MQSQASYETHAQKTFLRGDPRRCLDLYILSVQATVQYGRTYIHAHACLCFGGAARRGDSVDVGCVW